MKKVICVAAMALLGLVGAAARGAENPYGLPEGLYAEITTSKGVIVGELYYKKVPMTVANFVGLAEGTLGPKKEGFFKDMKFVRVDFVVEEGANGVKAFPDEMVPGLRHDSMGVMQMANDGPDTNGGWWCFMLQETERLNYLHTVFGHIVRGMDVLPKLAVNDTFNVKILRIGAEAEKFKVTAESFAEMVAKSKTYDGTAWNGGKGLPREPGPEAFFDDADRILPGAAPATAPARGRGRGPTNVAGRNFNFKLAKFYEFTGEMVKVRVFATMPQQFWASESLAVSEAHLKAYMDDLAAKLGMEKKGALAVYFADKDRWVVRIGKESQASFIAGPRKADGTKAPVAVGKTLDQAMDEFLAEAKKGAEAAAEGEAKGTIGGRGPQPPSEAQKIKLKVDAVVDGLIFRLEPAAK